MVVIAALFWAYVVFYIGMGIVQPLCAIIRIIRAKRKDSTYAIKLKQYLAAVLLYFLITPFVHDSLLLIYYMVIPWVFAIWYWSHIRKWKIKHKEIMEFNQMKALEGPHQDRLLLESYPTKKVKLTKPQIQKNRLKLTQKQAIIRKLKIPVLAH